MKKSKPAASDASRYESRHGATRKLSASQKLAELACERIAHHRGRSLVARFWQTLDWAATYRDQTRYASALLKIYDEEVIFRAFRDSPRIYSLGAPFFHEILRERDASHKAEMRAVEQSVPIETSDTCEAPRRLTKGNSIRARLNDKNK